MTHDDLVIQADKWLRRIGCGVVFNDGFRALTPNCEQPDAIGWRGGVSFLIECKASRSDFLVDRKKRFRINPELGMGDWRFMMCPPGIIGVDELPEGWGLLYATGKQVRKVHGIPGSSVYYSDRPFTGHQPSEAAMMYSALRRMELRGHLGEIYDGIPGKGD